MKILLRSYNGEAYVWRDAKFTKEQWFVNDKPVDQVNIVSILNDTRNKYVKCSACGETFLKGSKKWEEHIKPTCDTSKCFDCKYLRTESYDRLNTKYVELANDRYKRTTEDSVELTCNLTNFPYKNINDAESRKTCFYNRCTTATQEAVSDIFTEKPGIFDTIITIDQVVDKGYREIYKYSDCVQIRLKTKNSITAIVNKINIIDCFEVGYRSNSWCVFYSKKYDELYHKARIGGKYKYKVWDIYDIPNETRERIKKDIAALYVTEEEVNE